MNKAYWGLIAILVLALAAFAALSFMPDGVNVGGTRLKTASFAQDLFSTSESEKDSAATAEAAPAKPARAPMDTTSQVILFIGDSMLEGLGPRLAAYASENGHTLINVIWYSSSTEIWGSTTKVQEYINQFHPTYIFVCLGTNELFVSDIKHKRQRYLDNILAQIGDIPYVWIGPPNWKPDTGINEMLQASCAPGSFFLSNGQQFTRASDGAHPTRSSAAAWCDRVCSWVMTTGAHPIKLNRPTAARARCRTLVLQPVQ